MRIKADLHNHLRSGPNGPLPDFNDVIDRAFDKLGAGGIIGIVNFVGVDYRDRRYERFASSPGYDRCEFRNGLYVPEKSILVFKGQEVPIYEDKREVHLLALGVPREEDIATGGKIEDTLAESIEMGCINILEHLFTPWGMGRLLVKDPELEHRVLLNSDAVEVFNGMGFWKNRQARDYFERKRKRYPHLGAVKFSDGHSLREIGTSFSILEMPFSYDEFLRNPDEEGIEYLRTAIRATNGGELEGREHHSIIEGAPHIFGAILNYGVAKPICKLLNVKNPFERELVL